MQHPPSSLSGNTTAQHLVIVKGQLPFLADELDCTGPLVRATGRVLHKWGPSHARNVRLIPDLDQPPVSRSWHPSRVEIREAARV